MSVAQSLVAHKLGNVSSKALQPLVSLIISLADL